MSEEYEVRNDLLYTRDHEWLKAEDKHALIGMTDYAQKSLHEIIYVELPNVNQRLKQGEPIGSVESVKATSDILSPVTGRVVEVNKTLMDSPEVINESPYEDGWIVRMETARQTELENLMDPDEYRRYLDELEEEKE